MKLLGLCIVAVLAIGGSQARAEKVKANQPAKLLNHPGEQGKVLLKIKEGQSMTVLAKEGRWVKVRIQGRTGFVPRSKLDMADDGALVRNTRRRPFVDGRSTQRGAGSQEGPDDRIGADATESVSRDDDDDDRRTRSSRDTEEESADDTETSGKRKPKSHAGRRATGDADRDAEDSDAEDDDATANRHKGRKGDKGDNADKDDKRDSDDAAAESDRITTHVVRSAKVFSERDKDSEVVFTAKPSEALFPTDTKGTWTLVESAEGDIGWIPTASLAAEEERRPSRNRRRMIDIKGGLGVAFIQQSMSTTGTTLTGADQVPDIYSIGTAAAMIDVGGRILFPVGGKYLAGGELLFAAAKTVLGGVNYKATTTGLMMTDFHLRGVFGYPTHSLSGMLLLAHLGFRYRGYLVDDYGDVMKNPAKIPQETLMAPTLGLTVAFPALTAKLGLEVGLDAILFASSVTQTAGLEDGATPGMKSARLSLGGVYHWRPGLDLQAAYGLDYASYSFGAPAMQSMRGHTGTEVSRTDMIHTVSLGIAKGF